jgi:hypothetical protein
VLLMNVINSGRHTENSLDERVFTGSALLVHGGTSVMKVDSLTLGREPWKLRMLLPVRNPSLAFGARAPAAITFAMV